MAEFTFQCAYITDDHSSATGPVEPAYNTGAAPLFRGSYVVLSSTSPSSLQQLQQAGDTLGRIGG